MKTTANTVKAAAVMARDFEAGATFGWEGRQVFIAAVYAQTAQTVSLEAFKAELVALAAAGELELVRADLLGVMDPAMVAASETRRGESRYHFVVVA